MYKSFFKPKKYSIIYFDASEYCSLGQVKLFSFIPNGPGFDPSTGLRLLRIPFRRSDFKFLRRDVTCHFLLGRNWEHDRQLYFGSVNVSVRRDFEVQILILK